MGEVARTNGTSALTLAEGDPVALRAQIEQTRNELGDTVAALAIKADVKAQARERLDHTKAQALERLDVAKRQANEHRTPLIAAGAALVGLIALRIAKR
ncbi:DUF3618 domain-containing protein [Conexibacter stalactiti]|uniref:DUF3618 domain-containing protein n=1 Tax=Conexibacter stalactiti TaxID=1940611 RepID=A0ABU4HNJ9_9ACTN|nr:DUF3618 domain-containing protein [Conexibacter stalactiti]MDW5594887.1 DUF3618 domain-containing protein [Conexibacter stalactiti]MEC5035529.1 DUF3618 domain-containing protein [Conexibacter stalactiti]